MPRTARAAEAGLIYHVLNRGNRRMRLFRKGQDYEAFEHALAESLDRYPVDLLAYCVMPNHWHLVARPHTNDALGRWMGWLGVTHVRRHHAHYRRQAGGHLYQGRFKSFPVAEDEHFLALCRYVEANPLRAKLVKRAEQWRWSSLWRRTHRTADLPLGAWPMRRPAGWTRWVNLKFDQKRLEAMRCSVQRGRPLGAAEWVTETAARLGLDYTLRSPGRPAKPINE